MIVVLYHYTNIFLCSLRFHLCTLDTLINGLIYVTINFSSLYSPFLGVNVGWNWLVPLVDWGNEKNNKLGTFPLFTIWKKKKRWCQLIFPPPFPFVSFSNPVHSFNPLKKNKSNQRISTAVLVVSNPLARAVCACSHNRSRISELALLPPHFLLNSASCNFCHRTSLLVPRHAQAGFI